MPQKILGAQRDFSFGEVDVALKRADDHPARKAGLRQMANARILNSGSIQDRPGRTALYPINGTRTERFTVAAGVEFDINFAPSTINIINSAGTTVATFTTQGNGAPLPWASASDIQSIVYAVLNVAVTISLYLTFGHAMRPQVISFDGVSTWTIVDYAELVGAGGQKRTPFYRLSPQSVSMLPSATTGVITVDFSSPIVVAGMVGTRVRFAGRQILLGTVVSPTRMNATVIEPLPPAQVLTSTSTVGFFNIGDVVVGSLSGATGIVTATPNIQDVVMSIATPFPNIGQALSGAPSGASGVVIAANFIAGIFTVSLDTGTAFVVHDVVSGAWGSSTLAQVGGTNLTVQLLAQDSTASSFIEETVAGPSGTAVVSAVAVASPQAIAVWDDEIMNGYRGYPASLFVDQFRLGFCDFPAIPGGICWSAINSPTDIYANDASSPSNAIFEIAPRKVRVFHVVPGPEGSEFVIADRAMWYIPISVTNPLKPGSVAFTLLSGDGCSQVQPRLAQEAVLYVNAGQNSVMAVIATGAYNRPYNTKNLCEFHSHLFESIAAIAAPSADGTFNERYAYVLNGDGSIVVGKYNPDSLQTNTPVIGWGPWSGVGQVSWVSAYAADVLFTANYLGANIVDILDDAQFLDCALPVNAAPAAFAPPAGKGPLWFVASQAVSLIDQVTRSMGTYQVDANGFIVPQFNGGEDLSVASLVAGQPWTMIAEPFCPDAPASGSSIGQRMFKRRVSRFAANVIHSTGFIMARLFSGPLTPTSPALGTMMNFTRFPTWNQGDDPTKPPPQREIVERTRPIGRSFDPRVAVIKDTPGPLLISELGIEATI